MIRIPMVLALALLGGAALGQEAGERPAGCRLALQVVRDSCEIDRVYRCDGLPQGQRRVETWDGRTQLSVALIEDGILRREIASPAWQVLFEFPPGAVGRLLAAGQGAEEVMPFTRILDSAGGTQEIGGSLLMRHLGEDRLDLAGGPVRVIRFESVALTEDGARSAMRRLYGVADGVMLGLDGIEDSWRATAILGPGTPPAAGAADLPRDLDCRYVR